MIHNVLSTLVAVLDKHLLELSGGGPDEQDESRVVTPIGEHLDPVSFKQGAITLMVVNLEDERVPREADPYRHTREDGTHLAVRPSLRIVLKLLFVAQFADYVDSWKHLSAVIRLFHRHHIIVKDDAPMLGDGIERLVLELVTLSPADQNEIWSALRTTYRPSLLYKTRVVFADQEPVIAPPVRDPTLILKRRSPPLKRSPQSNLPKE